MLLSKYQEQTTIFTVKSYQELSHVAPCIRLDRCLSVGRLITKTSFSLYFANCQTSSPGDRLKERFFALFALLVVQFTFYVQKDKINDYEAQVQEMERSLQSRDNALWTGEKRLGMTKRIHNCRCELRVSYDVAQEHWKAKVTCGHHTDHCDVDVPTPPCLPSSVIEVLQKLRKDTGATVAQQLKFCSAHGFDVTPSFLRRLNSSVTADPTFGLSGDGGFVFTLLSLKD